MNYNKLHFILVVLTFTAITAAHSDIRPRVENAKIVTDAFNDDEGTFDRGVRTFGYDFGENADDPFFAADPGFNAVGAGGLPGGAQLRFNVLSPLSYWDGAGPVEFAAVSTGETLDLNLGGATVSISGSSAAQDGFAIQTITGSGTVHMHLNSFLNGPDGNTLPAGEGSWGAGDGIQAANGIYLIAIELLLNPASGIAGSDPIYIVFNNGLEESLHDSAIDWVNETLVPEPALLGAIGGAVGLLTRRRSRSADARTRKCGSFA